MLDDVLKARGVSEVAWFHTDHWEPWSSGIGDVTLRRVEAFGKQAGRSRFARKMTLFYLDGINYQIAGQGGDAAAAVSLPGDFIEFVPRNEPEKARARDAVGEVGVRTDVEFQLHVHHESFTANDGDWNEVSRLVRDHSDPALDERRLRLLIQLALENARRDTGQSFDHWAFIHGCWALNGSDSTVCNVPNEIEILMEFGCWGDFSFPAGRPHCDPATLLQPYSVKPFSALKAYDLPEAQPMVVDVGASAIVPGRFLIWNSAAKANVCSLDVAAAEDRRRLQQSEHLAVSWLRGCPVIDGVLYIKTHAHSMNAAYYEEDATIPLCHPDVVRLFDLLQRSCDQANVELRLRSVDQIYRELRHIDNASERARRVPASPSFDPRRDTAKLEAAALSAAMAWVSADESHLRNAGAYYTNRFDQGRFFPDHDIYLANYCARNLSGTELMVELGVGFGELSLLLAFRGFQVLGFESDEVRYSAATAVLEAVRGNEPMFGRIEMVRGTYPGAFSSTTRKNRGKVALVCSHIASTYLSENLQEVLDSLVGFADVIIDVTTFGRPREEIKARELIQDIETLGFTVMNDVFREFST